ncbi:MAG: flagellar biosynthesis protein FlhA [Deltaproteobacteria bacterium]|nr:flagellar biosynthesis protein FlhA [Deltaproteobacteria bacterium]
MNEVSDKRIASSQAGMALAVVGVLSILILPLPAPVMDVLIAFNVSISILILLISLSLKQPLEFSVFPSMLLVTTLFRLGLNVATTRLILGTGGEGAGAAGGIIEAFGRFAVGGSIVVGTVVFTILMVVNFAVITKGSGRIAEVAARFTLDALPGKQMAIDADLAAGNITELVARTRRESLQREAEFFGAMDGASKFVRGDVVAGLIITVINIIGGLVAGMVRDGLSLANAFETYTILTIGDGLVSQIPALLVSTAAGVVVTRAGSGQHFGIEVASQIFGEPRTLRFASVTMGVFALLPGMPAIPFLGLSAGAYILSRRKPPTKEAVARAAAKAAESEKPQGDRLQDLISLDVLEVEVGHSLLPLIDLERGGELPGRVTTLRRQIATEFGVMLPPVHLRDNLRLDAHEYRIRLRGMDIGKGTAYADRLMALDPLGAEPQLDDVDAIPAREPAFGLPAVWIPHENRAQAEMRGLTIVDPASVLTTHLSETIKKNAHELIGRQEVQDLLGVIGKESPKLVEDVIPNAVSLGEFVRVVRGLLRESLSVRDLPSVLEAVADAAPRSKDPAFLVEQVRRRLFRQITARIADPTGTVHAVTLDRESEDVLRRSLGASEGEAVLAPDIDTARRLVAELEKMAARQAAEGRSMVVITSPDLRRPLFDFGSRFVNDLFVVTARELTPGTSVQPVGTIELGPRAIGRAA